jgi:hypothetical protein
MFTLSYSGQRTVVENKSQTAHKLLDDLLTLHNTDSVVNVGVGQIRPQNGDLLLVVSLSAEADISTLKSTRTELAEGLVTLSVEPDVETAKTNIQISG